MLSREDILAVDDLERRRVPVPEWGGDVFVRMLTGKERERFELDTDTLTKRCAVRATWIASTVCDESGALIFEPDDVEALNEKGSAPLQRLFDAALELNRFTAGDIEELEGNSDGTPADYSLSA